MTKSNVHPFPQKKASEKIMTPKGMGEKMVSYITWSSKSPFNLWGSGDRTRSHTSHVDFDALTDMCLDG